MLYSYSLISQIAIIIQGSIIETFSGAPSTEFVLPRALLNTSDPIVSIEESGKKGEKGTRSRQAIEAFARRLGIELGNSQASRELSLWKQRKLLRDGRNQPSQANRKRRHELRAESSGGYNHRNDTEARPEEV